MNHSPLPRLLIADDDAVVSSALSAQLRHEFEIVAGARDADEAIALATAHQPDIALIDVQMPAGGGLRATKAIHECAPDTAVVALSADESDASVREMLAAGAIAYLRKGADGHELAMTLRRSIAAHAALAPPVLDAGVLADLRAQFAGGNEAAFEEIVSLFTDQARRDLAAIGAALEQRDAAALSATAHSLRGASANLGGIEVATLCAELEEAARAGITPAAHALRAPLERAVERTSAALHKELARA